MHGIQKILEENGLLKYLCASQFFETGMSFTVAKMSLKIFLRTDHTDIVLFISSNKVECSFLLYTLHIEKFAILGSPN